MSRRLYRLGCIDGDTRLRILDPGARPRRHSPILGRLGDGHTVMGVVVGYDLAGRPIVEVLVGRTEAARRPGARVWFRGSEAQRRRERIGLLAPGPWLAWFRRQAWQDLVDGRLTVVRIDGTPSTVFACSPDGAFLATAPLSRTETRVFRARQAAGEAHIIVLNSEIKARYSTHRNIPIPENTEAFELFGPEHPWLMLVPAEDDPETIVSGRQSQQRPGEPAIVYQTTDTLTAHIWRAGPRGGHLIGFEYNHTGTIAGSIPWTSKRDHAIRQISHENRE